MVGDCGSHCGNVPLPSLRNRQSVTWLGTVAYLESPAGPHPRSISAGAHHPDTRGLRAPWGQSACARTFPVGGGVARKPCKNALPPAVLVASRLVSTLEPPGNPPQTAFGLPHEPPPEYPGFGVGAEAVTEGLLAPWSVDWTPDGTIIFSGMRSLKTIPNGTGAP